MKVYLDSCIVIYLIEGEPIRRQAVETIMNQLTPESCLSDLVRLECKIRPLREKDEGTLQRFEGFFTNAFIIPLRPEVYDLAAELRAQHRLKTPDAIHAAAAILHGCDEFWTNDRRLAAIESRIALRALPNSTAQ